MNKLFVSSIALAVISFNCFASSFSISPVEINLKNNKEIQEIKITNNNDYLSIIQLDALDWQQDNTSNVYKKTNNLIISPKVLHIKPKSTQIVRVASRKNNDQDIENTYRINIREVLAPKTNANVALAFNIPAFVLPKNINKNFSMKLEYANNKYQLNISNPGNTRRHLSQIKFIDSDTNSPVLELKSFTYVHAKQKHNIAINDNKLHKLIKNKKKLFLSVNVDGKQEKIDISNSS